MDKQYLAILLINDPTPHIGNPNVTWRFDPKLFQMNIEIWKKYMHNNENILVLFVQGDISIVSGNALFDKENHILKIHMSSEHTYENPQCATQLTLEMFNIINTNFKYDFLIRSTTSSFWVFDSLDKMLRTLPKTKVYKGSKMFHTENAISGSGFILSKDVVELILKGTNILKDTIQWDDVLFSRYALLFDIPLEDMQICNIDSIDNIPQRIRDADKESIVQFKVKTGKHRLEYDTIIMNLLYEYFYDKNE